MAHGALPMPLTAAACTSPWPPPPVTAGIGHLCAFSASGAVKAAFPAGGLLASSDKGPGFLKPGRCVSLRTLLWGGGSWPGGNAAPPPPAWALSVATAKRHSRRACVQAPSAAETCSGCPHAWDPLPGPSESAHGAQGFSAVEPLPLAALTRAVVVSDCAWM